MELRVNRRNGDQPLSVLLREARFEADLSQKELGDHLGVSTRTVQYWEAGKVPRPKHRRLIREFISFVNCEEAA